MIRIILIILFTCACVIMQAQVNVIKTICGKDTAGYCCDGEPAVTAKLNYPFSLCYDKFDNIYFSDAFNQRVRKVDHVTGSITTFAGTGNSGYSGDNGLAANAELFLPCGIAMDTSGNMYIADAENNVIRKIDAVTNIITTFAGNGVAGDSGDGGLAVNAELNKPCGICIDKSGNVIITDEFNNKVRKISITTGIISTVAGTGTIGYSGDHELAVNAEFNNPGAVFIDSADNIFIADTYNNVVRKIDISTGVITTIAGNGVAAYFGDNGLAINAEFYLPIGIYIDKRQNIFIADDENGAVRKIDANTGIITTVAGTGVPGYSGDHGPATAAQVIPTDIFFDSNGNMFIADAGNNCIREVYNPTGIKEPINVSEVKVYPNPTTGKFTIQTSGQKQYAIDVSNVVGEKILQSVSNGASAEIDISDQPPGLYFVHLQSGDERIVEKVVVSK